MYLSCLLIDVGEDPDRPRPGRLWLRNLYRVHQRLCMAFPSATRKSEDSDFLQPFKPEDFAAKQVHVERGTDAGFLFRIDPQLHSRVMVLVQSAIEPDWDYAFHNARHFLAGPPQTKPFNPEFRQGMRLRFRLLANPVRKVSARSVGDDGEPVDKKWIGKEVPVPTGGLARWLERRAEPAWSAPRNSKQPPPGFGLFDIEGQIDKRNKLQIVAGYVYINHGHGNTNTGRRLRSARYEGALEVTDPARFRETVLTGIGHGKAFGFGLLSLAKV